MGTSDVAQMKGRLAWAWPLLQHGGYAGPKPLLVPGVTLKQGALFAYMVGREFELEKGDVGYTKELVDE